MENKFIPKLNNNFDNSTQKLLIKGKDIVIPIEKTPI